jgi:hypothetical protein
MKQPTHYEVLGVQPDAPMEVIEAAYRAQSKRYHPDLRGHHASNEKFARVTEAYDVLRDPERRRAYDEKLAANARTVSSESRTTATESVPPIRPEVMAVDSAVRSLLPVLRPIGAVLATLVRSARDIHIGPIGRHRLHEPPRHDNHQRETTFDIVARLLKEMPKHAPGTGINETPNVISARLTIPCPPGASVEAAVALTRTTTGTYLEYQLREFVWRVPLGIALGVGVFLLAATHWWFLSAVVALYVYLPLKWWQRRQHATTLDSVANQLAPFQSKLFPILDEHAASLASLLRQMIELPTRRGVEVHAMRFGGGPPVVGQTKGIPVPFKAPQTSCELVASALAGMIWEKFPGWITIGRAGGAVGPGEAKLRVVMPLPEAAESIVDIHFVARLNTVTATQNSYAFTPMGASSMWVSLTLPAVFAVLIWPRLPDHHALIVVITGLVTALLAAGSWQHINSVPRRTTAQDESRHSAAVINVQVLLMAASLALPTLTAREPDISDVAIPSRPPLFLRVLRVVGAMGAAVFTWQAFAGLGSALLQQQGGQTALGSIIFLCLVLPACGAILFLTSLSVFWHSAREAPQTRTMVYAAVALAPLLLVGPVGSAVGGAMRGIVAEPTTGQAAGPTHAQRIDAARNALKKTQLSFEELNRVTTQIEAEYRNAVGHTISDANGGQFPIGFAAALTRRESLRQSLADVLNAWTEARRVIQSGAEVSAISARLDAGTTEAQDEVSLAELSSQAVTAMTGLKRAQEHIETMKSVFAMESLLQDQPAKDSQ